MAEDLEARLARIEARLDAIEHRLGPVRVPHPSTYAAAPPVYSSPDAYRSAPGASSEEIEQLLGARWLPRVGALALLAGLAVLIGIGLQRGVITPAMVALATAALCFLSIVAGNLLRHEREQFGDVLVGLGFGGLYVDVVGSHLFQKLIAAETMVACCLVLGLLTVAYGAWRARPVFVAFGLVGAISAALMPLQRSGGYEASVPLLLIAAIPAFIVATLRRWPTMVITVWIASALAALPALEAGNLSTTLRLLPFGVFLLFALAGYLVIDAPDPHVDPSKAFPPVAASIVSVFVLCASLESRTAYLLGFGLAIAVAGLVFYRRALGRSTFLAGAAMALLWAPLGQPFLSATVSLAVLALGTVVAQKIRKEPFWPFAGAQAIFAFGEYGVRLTDNRPIPNATETGVIGLLAVVAIVVALSVGRSEARVAATLALWGLASRFAFVALPMPGSAAITLAWSTVFAGALALGFAYRRPELRQVGLAVAAVTLGKIVVVDLSSLDAALRALLLLVLGALLLAGGYAYVRAGRSTR